MALIDYNKAVKAVADRLARDDGVAVARAKHYNEAKRVLWPLLEPSAQSSRVLR